ncbi:hypothetical protein D9615_003269 [Tricholomella constricta]|uniref:Uncharacterized protein n=1 Tax=Tricholomella constricta TaxID=117010 RepID=A0A8H5M7W3_9AGAR|nr:hypothetical protein D9615_003269 [Tricholomella constricta]
MVRRIPALPQDLPPVPYLRKIVKAFPMGASSKRAKHRHGISNQSKLVYPDLSAFPSADIANDLEFLLQARTERERSRGVGYDPHDHRTVNPNINGAPIGGPSMEMNHIAHPLGAYDAYNDGVPMGGSRAFSNIPLGVDHRIQIITNRFLRECAKIYHKSHKSEPAGGSSFVQLVSKLSLSFAPTTHHLQILLPNHFLSQYAPKALSPHAHLGNPL